MSQENVQVVERAIAAVNERDVDGYLACCTDDIELHNQVTALTGPYAGPDGIRRFFSDIEDAGPDFLIDVERVEPVGANRVLAFVRVHVSGRTSGVPMEFDAGNVYDFADGSIRRVRIFTDRAQALEAVGLRE
jgi:ketosteroid isomerase-like protein